MATKRPPKVPLSADDENIKTVKLSATELREQLEALGVNMDSPHEDTGDDAKPSSSAD